MSKTNKNIAIIPARFQSQRLLGKPILNLGDIPIVVRVWQNISKSDLLDKVIVATDDERISSVLDKYNVPYVMTSPLLPSGTDRIYEALCQIGGDYDVVVNVQGDEPFLLAEDVDKLIAEFDTSKYDVATFVSRIENLEDLKNPNNVKVALSDNFRAVYFSRSPIPFLRDFVMEDWLSNNVYWKHIGIYAYSKTALEAFVKLPQSNLEKIEKLEQLRLLEQGFSFRCVELNKKLIGIDTLEDLELAQKMI